jgi:ABC-2 type transport system ATP-binding protein
MRLILALDNPSAGIVNINGKPYQQSAASMRKVGTLLDAKAVHGRRKTP